MLYINILFVFLFGLIIGSFINCLVYRLHKKKSMWGRSFCPKCKSQLAWYENIPVLSFLFLRAKCGHCRKKISWEYPVVEFVTGVLFVVSFLVNSKFQIPNFDLFINYKLLIINLRDWFVISVLIVVFIYDLKWYLILDRVTLPSALIIFIANICLGVDWKNLALSGIIGGSFFLIQFLISKGKWVGGGDVRLGLLMGFILGFPLILLALFLAYIIGSIIGVGLILANKKGWKSEVPMGVFLTVSTIITMFWGQEIMSWYLNFLY